MPACYPDTIWKNKVFFPIDNAKVVINSRLIKIFLDNYSIEFGLRNSITSNVSGETGEVGTNVEYAP